MFIETIDLLRCPRDHDETWLVAAFTRMNGRFVIDGSLGCPICEATYAIADGVAHFSGGRGIVPAPDSSPVEPDHAVRIAAFLDLVRPGSIAVLEGPEATFATAVANITQCRVIALNPSTAVDDTELTSTIYAGSRIPLASSSVDGIASVTGDIVSDAARVLRSGGRVIAPVGTSLPPSVTELARDEHRVVAESRGPLIRLSR